MFGFGKAKEKKPKEPRRQGFMTEDDKWVEFGPDEPLSMKANDGDSSAKAPCGLRYVQTMATV
jgi:hypothetical protein